MSAFTRNKTGDSGKVAGAITRLNAAASPSAHLRLRNTSIHNPQRPTGPRKNLNLLISKCYCNDVESLRVGREGRSLKWNL